MPFQSTKVSGINKGLEYAGTHGSLEMEKADYNIILKESHVSGTVRSSKS